MSKEKIYKDTVDRIKLLITGETDDVAIMATVVCELRSAFNYFDWVGFYRVTEPKLLKVGPYQGGHGCLQISFDRGVCGKCATDKETQVVPNVNDLPYHIACLSSTLSEVVVPVLDKSGEVIAVLDVDSDQKNMFDDVDKKHLESVAELISSQIF